MAGEIEPRPEQQSPAVTGGKQLWMQQFLDNQSKEIELRFQQARLDELKEQHAFEYSTKALAAQASYLQEEHTHGSDRFRSKCWMAVVLSLFGLAFLTIVILSGNGQIALELIKVAVYGGLGAFGGYGYAKGKRAEVPIPPETES
jgi:hypothetical protein